MSRDDKLREAELQRVYRAKVRVNKPAQQLGEPMVEFFKTVQKRQGKFAKLGESWVALVPPTLDTHCCLESFTRGTLTVLVDSSSHLYELKQLLLSGLEKQLLIANRVAGLRKISLKPGRWYSGDDVEIGRLDFTPRDPDAPPNPRGRR